MIVCYSSGLCALLQYLNIAASEASTPAESDYRIINVGSGFSKVRVLYNAKLFAVTYPELNRVNFYSIEDIGCVVDITPK